MQNHSKSAIIACDVGLKRIGLATIINDIILPLEPIIRKNRNQAARDLREMLQKRETKTLVVGLPEDVKSTEQCAYSSTTNPKSSTASAHEQIAQNPTAQNPTASAQATNKPPHKNPLHEQIAQNPTTQNPLDSINSLDFIPNPTRPTRPTNIANTPHARPTPPTNQANDSSQSPTATRIRHFISLLDCVSLPCEVVFVDESFSSICALENLSHTTKSTRKKASKDGRLDSLSACEILRRYVQKIQYVQKPQK